MIQAYLLNLTSIAALGVMLLSSCAVSAQDNEAFIQGKWRLQGESPQDRSRYIRVWYIEWTFANGAFVQIGYPPIRQEGKYRIVKEEDSKMTLELYEQKGNFGTKDQQIKLVVDRENEKLNIWNQAGFTRVAASREH